MIGWTSRMRYNSPINYYYIRVYPPFNSFWIMNISIILNLNIIYIFTFTYKYVKRIDYKQIRWGFIIKQLVIGRIVRQGYMSVNHCFQSEGNVMLFKPARSFFNGKLVKFRVKGYLGLYVSYSFTSLFELLRSIF